MCSTWSKSGIRDTQVFKFLTFRVHVIKLTNIGKEYEICIVLMIRHSCNLQLRHNFNERPTHEKFKLENFKERVT